MIGAVPLTAAAGLREARVPLAAATIMISSVIRVIAPEALAFDALVYDRGMITSRSKSLKMQPI
jgi:hypothetical protein